MQNNISCGHGPSIVRLENKIDRLFLILENQNEELTEIKKLMLRVLRGSNTSPEGQPLPEGVNFPLSNLDDVWNLEEHLLDPSKSHRVLAELTIIGGNSLKDIVCQLMRTTLSASLAEQFCWNGSSVGKRSFAELKLKDVVMRAVRKNSKTKDATNNEIKKCVQEWFRSAPDRNGRRNKRQRPAE
ncbi:uncharacterized protein [Littorina saxatilis]|uniref:uncharacterized protein n=1 Tax=Littorina saxatilis TaxID=31220 RepID=UPI0038B52434